MNMNSSHPHRRRAYHSVPRRKTKIKFHYGRLILSFAILAAAILLVYQIIGAFRSCSATRPLGEATEAGHTVVAADSAAWNLGVVHAGEFLKLRTDTVAMGDMFLEVRARETNFRKRLRPSAADAYVAGFETAIRRADPDLGHYFFD